MRLKLAEAVKLLLDQNVVAVPTETVYGLSGLFDSPLAIESIFRLKKRPPKNPLIIHIDSSNSIKGYIGSVPEHFEELAEAFWPGPMTLVLPADEKKISSKVRAGLPTVAFRVPNHPMALELLRRTGPLAAPSANLSGKPSATSPEHVERDFGVEFPVLDGGRSDNGLESTILAFRDNKWQIARLGAIPKEAFGRVLPYMPENADSSTQSSPICPGQLFRHYAPQAILHLDKDFSQAEVIIGFSDRIYPEGARLFALGPSNDPQAAAFELYNILRRLDSEGISEAWVDREFPKEGLWATIYERLHKAAQR